MRLVCLCALRKEVEVTSAVDRCTASFGAVRLTSSIGSRGQGPFIQGRTFQLGKLWSFAGDQIHQIHCPRIKPCYLT